ncbi:MAG: hypothetical protein WHV67_06810 [Thermoanaerobaculia bacterium]
MFLRFFLLFILFSHFVFPAILKDVVLKFKPTSSLSDYDNLDLSGLTNVSLCLGDFYDEREDKNLIGENKEEEDKGKILPVTTATPVGDFLKEVYTKLFKDVGIKIVQNGEKKLELKIIKFYVEEKNLYKAEVWLDIKILKGGSVLWEDRIMGSAKRFGRSYKLENYLESLSDAILDGFASLFQNGKFLEAIKK